MSTGQQPQTPTGNTTPENTPQPNTGGIFAAFAAFTAWGVLTAYWKSVGHLPAAAVVCHRLFWSLLFLWIILPMRGRWGDYLAAFKSPRILGVHLISGLLIGSNWFIFIWATLNGRIVESALGYFLSPLAIVGIGALVFKEPLNRTQLIAIVLAAIGVLIQLPLLNHFPWVAITLALTFALYGMVRKKSPLGSLTGLAVETTYFFIPCIIWLSMIDRGGWSEITFADPTTSTLLILSGIVTALPLLWFAYATRNVRYSTIGIIQYLAPSLQFLLGVFVYGEEMPPARLATFIFIWVASSLYVVGMKKKTAIA